MAQVHITFEDAVRLLAQNPHRQDLEIYSMGIKQQVLAVKKRKKITRYPWKVKTNRFVLLYELSATNIIYQVR